MFKFFGDDVDNDSGIDEKRYLVFRFLILIMPNIVDIILTIISYDKDYKTYYIIRYVSQVLDIICCFIFAWILSYNVDCDEDDGCSTFTIYSFIIIPFFVIAKEIPSLIFFIKDFADLVILSKVGFFIHLISSLFILISFIVLGIKCWLSDYFF